MLKKLFVLLLLAFSIPLTAQQPLYTSFKSFKVEDGLPQSFVSGLQQDKDGFLWIGSRDGLARYDGREFKIFRSHPADSLGLHSNVIIDLFLDAQNLLWVFYVNEKVDCFDPRRMQVRYSDSFSVVRNLMKELKVKKFSRDHKGRFWFNSTYKGVICYDPLQNKTIWYDSLHGNLRSNKNLGVTESAKGKIYAFTDKGIETLNTGKDESTSFTAFSPSLNFKFIPGAFHQTIALPDGRIVLSETNRLIIFDPVQKIFSSHTIPGNLPAESNIIQHLQVAKDGLLYFVAAGAVYRFEKNNSFTCLWQSQSTNPFANDAKSFLIDQSMVMWFGTNAAGMYKVNLRAVPFTNSPYKVNLTYDVLSGLVESPARLPVQLQEGKWAYGLRSCYDRSNNLWLTAKKFDSENGSLDVYMLNGKKLYPVSSPQGEFPALRGLSTGASGEIFGIDIRGNIWKWENEKSNPLFIPSVLHLPNTVSITDLAADNNVFWVATDKKGLFKIEKEKVEELFSLENKSKQLSWPTNQLTSLCKDPLDKDILWIGTLGYGLIRFNKKTYAIKTFTTKDNLPNNTVYSIVPDKEGNLWISTNNGISRFSKDRTDFNNFDIRDGLIGNEFNRFHHLRFPDGRIAFGGPEGYSVFDPAAFVMDDFPTKVEITNLLVNNKSTRFTLGSKHSSKTSNGVEQLTFPYNQNFLQFEFAGLQFNQPEKIRYRYMLKGYDKDWIETGNRNIASYTKLPSGHYNLLLNASNTSGKWSPEIKQIAIRIKPPVWATWWAYTIYGFIVLSLVWAYWKYRNNRIRMQNEILLEQNKAKQLKEVEEIKDRFFSNITHELRTPLTLILTPLEKLKGESEYSPANQQVLSNAHKNAEQLLRLINQLLDISKIGSGQMTVNTTAGDMAEFVERCIQQFSMTARKKNIQLRFTNSNVTGCFYFDEEKWEKIIFNLLSNAIKFTSDGGEVSASMEWIDEPGNIRFKVADTGVGIREEEIQKIFDRFYMANDTTTKKQSGTGIGLSLVKELAELMKGKIEVSSVYAKGSEFIVDIPIEKAINENKGEITKTTTSFIKAGKPPASVALAKKEGPLVLIAEDNDELRSFLAESLSANWRVLQTANGKEAWESILNELPDIVISDVMMPEMDGLELCRLVKEDNRTGHISVILLTAKAAHESRLTGLKTGADEYLTKPFHLDELELRLQNMLLQQERLRNHLRKELLPEAPLKKLPHVNDIFIQGLYKELDDLLIDPNFSVEILAQKMAMSQRTLNRKLKAILNITPVEFIRRYRLQKAAVLISSGHNISDAAYSVGFDTASYFTQCFKDEFGKTPTEFLNQKTA